MPSPHDPAAGRGVFGRGAAGPTDWTSGERVFAPPSGTLDVDWLVPAVLESVPGTSPAVALDALRRAAAALRGAVDGAVGSRVDGAVADAAAGTVSDAPSRPEERGRGLAVSETDALDRAATAIVLAAREAFRA